MLALVWSALVFAIYLANGREIWSGDSVPAKYLSCAIVRGDGFYLDRYRPLVLKWWPNPGMPYYATVVDGHYGLALSDRHRQLWRFRSRCRRC